MRIKTLATALFATLILATAGWAMEGMDHGKSNGKNMEKFVHAETVDGVMAEFQVMSLASMNMEDDSGATHHVMASFMRADNHKPMANVAGKVKLISPSGKEQVAALKDYGTTFAANFTIDEPGKWGVICLFKTPDGEKHLVKFWYPHK